MEITEGDCSGDWKVTKVKELNGKQAAKALIEQGSEPSFFGLTDDGEDEQERRDEKNGLYGDKVDAAN